MWIFANLAKGNKMKTIVILLLLASFIVFTSGCVPPGQVKKETTPGHIQKSTGYNPASGKVKHK